MMMMIGMISRR